MAAAISAFLMPDAGRGLTLQAVLGICGLLAAPIAFVFTLIKAVDTWQMGRLVRGEGIVARWRIDAADWQAFVQNEDRLDQQPGRRPNLLSYRDLPAASGIEIIVGKNAVLIGGEYHTLRKRGFANLYGPHWLRGSPSNIQFDLTAFVTGGTHAMRWVLRFPVAPDAENRAALVIAHFQAPAARASRRNPHRARNIALAISAVGAAAFAIALLLRGSIQNQDLLAGIAVTGVLISLFSLIPALVWHLDLRKSRGQ